MRPDCSWLEVSPVLGAEREREPEGVHRGLVGEIISRLERRGLKLVGVKMLMPGRDHFQAHYAEHSARPFYPGLVAYMASGPVVATCWEGEDVVRLTRTMLGQSDPKDSEAATIRGDYGVQAGFFTAEVEDSSEELLRQLSDAIKNQMTQMFISCSTLDLYGMRALIIGPLLAWKPTILVP